MSNPSTAQRVVSEFKAGFSAFERANLARIERLSEDMDARFPDANLRQEAIDEAHWDLLDDLKGYLSSKVLNESNCPADEDECEALVADSISNSIDTVALALWARGLGDGGEWLLRQLDASVCAN